MDNTPWYRQFWPWFLFGMPGLVVVAGLTTWWIAANNADSLVADDYYKEGLAINRVLEKQQLALTRGIEASVDYREGAIEVRLAGKDHPGALLLQLSHPVDAAKDRDLKLAQTAPGSYRSTIELPQSSRWLWQLEPIGATEEASWRIDGELVLSGVDAR